MTLKRFAKAASCRETEKGKDDGQSHRIDSHNEELDSTGLESES